MLGGTSVSFSPQQAQRLYVSAAYSFARVTVTGYGAYLLSVGLSYLSACIEDEPVEIRSLPGGWLPWVGRTTVERRPLPDEKSLGGNSIAMDRNVSGTGYGSSNESGYVKENGKVKD